MAFDLLVVGDCNPDLLLVGGDVEPEFGQREKLVGSAQLVVGGSAAIAACGAARLGLDTAFIGTVGSDLFGTFMLDALADRGVDVSACVVDRAMPTGGARGALARKGEKVVEAAAPEVDVVDATGAGDSFDAGFLAARLAGEPLPTALALACACGALSTRALGGTAAQPTLAEAREALP